MPTYQYLCTECGRDLEVVQKFSDPSLTVCPECQGVLRKVYNAVGVVFKGSGFYRTDSRASSGSDSGASASGKGSGDKSSGDKGAGDKTSGEKAAGTKTSGDTSGTSGGKSESARTTSLSSAKATAGASSTG